MTLLALKNIRWQSMIALLALMRSSNVAPTIMVALMPCSEVLNGLRKPVFVSWPNFLRLTSNNLIRACNETILVPLSAAAGLPAFATYVAELTPAFTTFNGQ
jgi:hypothetical protein